MGETTNGEKSGASDARRAARGTLLTLVLRVVSFVATQVTFRLVSISSLGQASVELELWLSTILFISREGFRLGLTQAQTSETTLPEAQYQRIAFTSLFANTLFCGVILLWHLSRESSTKDFYVGGLCYVTAAWLEGWCETKVICGVLRRLRLEVKGAAEGLGSMLKTSAILVSLVWVIPNYPVASFGVGQLVYAITLNVVYSMNVKDVRYLPIPVKSDKVDDIIVGPNSRSLYNLIGILSLQGVLKHILTEGDRLILVSLSDHYHQGVYAIAASYGGMAARLLFQPCEETARLFWGRLTDEEERVVSYTALTKAVLYIGCCFVFLATNYCGVLLQLLRQPQEASAVLSAFCVYTGLLAWNGMTEAFVYANLHDKSDVGRLSVVHTLVGGVFWVVAPFLVAYDHPIWGGTVGLVVANMVGMGLRITYSIWFAAKRQLKSQSMLSLLGRMLPHPAVLLAFALSWIATYWSWQQYEASDKSLGAIIRHVGMGASCAIGIAGIAVFTERRFRKDIRQTFSNDKKKRE